MISPSKLIAVTALVGGLGLAGLGISHAQSTNTSVPTTTTAVTTAATTTPADVDMAVSAPTTRPDPSMGGHVGSNGTKEELLTGDTASKVRTAALAAVSGGTVQRVETDAEGATYEAHMTKADGSAVTVKLDADFKVAVTESGMGGGPR